MSCRFLLAGFQLSLIGRFWVSPEGKQRIRGAVNDRIGIEPKSRILGIASGLPTIQTERCRTVSDNVVSLVATGQNRTVPDASATRRARKINVEAALPNRQHTPASLSFS